MTQAPGKNCFSFPELHLETAALTNLAGIWQNLSLGGYCWRLYYHDSGGAGLVLNGTRIELTPDKLYLLAPNCNLHTWVKGSPTQLYLHFILSSATCSDRYPVTALPFEGVLKELTLLLTNALRDPEAGRIKRYLLASSLASAATANLPAGIFSGMDSDRRVMDTCAYMREHLSRPLDISSLANMAGMSENNFLTLFRKQTSSTPYQYLLHLRYSRAASLLESGKYTIDEICDAIGVRDRFHFSRTFKKIYGSAPAAYRRNFMLHNKNIDS